MTDEDLCILEPGIYEECGDCPPDGLCLVCMDEGLVPHDC